MPLQVTEIYLRTKEQTNMQRKADRAVIEQDALSAGITALQNLPQSDTRDALITTYQNRLANAQAYAQHYATIAADVVS